MKNNLLKSQSAQVTFEAALKQGIDVKIISKRFNLFRLKHNGSSLYIKGTSYPVNPQPACFIANNKYLTKQVLKENQLPTPRSWLVRTPLETKKAVLKNNLFPCVLKPARGAHGKRVFANIESLEELKEIIPLVFTRPGRRNVLLEEFIEGIDYRFLVVGDKVSAVMERIPAHVIGNGEDNIRQLIKQFNQQPLVGEKYEKPLCKIKVNGEVKRVLKKQNKKLAYIPQSGEKVFLRQNTNISTGGIGKDVTKSVNQELKNLAIKAAAAIGIKITGVDMIYNQKTNKAYILELNDCPGIDIHHYPVIGEPQNVAKDIVDFILKES